MADPTNVIFGCSGLRLSAQEKMFFAECNPWGLIVFSRNLQSPDQVRALIADFLDSVSRDNAMILIDQEGGRVSRLPGTHWRVPPSPTVFARLYESDPISAVEGIRLNYQLIAYDLKELGINVNCAPMIDVPQAGASSIVTERALGQDPESVCALAEATIDGLRVGGVAPVIKHAPGHGRATVDSHATLPCVSASRAELQSCDFLPFKRFAGESMLMTAHIIYSAIDESRAATLSPTIINEVIRQEIGFQGLIMTDDINMQALSGTIAQRAELSLKAGCDVVLHCNGNLEQMQQVLKTVFELRGESLDRASRAESKAFLPTQIIDLAEIEAGLNAILPAHLT